MKTSSAKERVRLLKRQERVSSPDHEDVIVSPDQCVVSPAVSHDSERAQREVTDRSGQDVIISPVQGIMSPAVSHDTEKAQGAVATNSDQEAVTSLAEVTAATSVETENTIKIEPLAVSISSTCTKEENNLVCNNVLDTIINESKNVDKSEEISVPVSNSDQSEILCETNRTDDSALRQTEETAEYVHSYSDTMVTVMQDQDVLDSSIGIVNIPELVSSSSAENPVIVVRDYPVMSEVETLNSEEHL